MLFKFALVTSGIISFLNNITVIGPGQNLSIIFFAISGISLTYLLMSLLLTWTIKGLSWGLPLAINIFFTASSFKAFAPKPYTVSVGNMTTFPFFISFPIALMFASLGFVLKSSSLYPISADEITPIPPSLLTFPAKLCIETPTPIPPWIIGYLLSLFPTFIPFI